MIGRFKGPPKAWGSVQPLEGPSGQAVSRGMLSAITDISRTQTFSWYPIAHIAIENVTTDPATDIWPYKFDTTSLAMRSVAEHLGLPTWPKCLFYKSHCDAAAGLSPSTLFSMIDSLIEGMARQSHPRNEKVIPPQLTLRTASEYKDRLHHYAFPWFFDRITKRTTQAIYKVYNPSIGQTATLCGNQELQPYSCNEIWTKYVYGICGQNHLHACGDSMWVDIPKRYDAMLATYPNHTLDFIVLDSMEDLTRGGLSFQGRKYFDFVTLARVRKCPDGTVTDGATCETVAVDDYRYESAYFTMDAPSWFTIVVTLRVIGQGYMMLRLLSLIVGCWVATSQRRSHNPRNLGVQLVAVVRTLFLIPSQVVVYGSSAPILLYVAAHLIDSPAIYELVTTHFDSWLGGLKINMHDFTKHCAVSTRTVWTLGLAAHIMLAIKTHTCWSPVRGVPGVPEFSITIVACVTIMAQYRSLAFRSTRIYEIHEVVPSASRTQHQSQSYDTTRGAINNLLSGSPIDMQCVSSVLSIVLALAAISRALHKAAPHQFPIFVSLTARTSTPYSAGFLWPQSRLVVSWPASLVEHEPIRPSHIHVTPRGIMHRRLSQLGQYALHTALAALTTPTRQSTRCDLHDIDKRSRETESAILLINLAAMTDPLTLVQLRLGAGRRIAIFECKRTGRRVLLPHSLARSTADVSIDWRELELVAVVDSTRLTWRELLQCG